MKTSGFTLKQMSPCLKIFIESLLAENGCEISIEELFLVDDDVVSDGLIDDGLSVIAPPTSARPSLARNRNYN